MGRHRALVSRFGIDWYTGTQGRVELIRIASYSRGRRDSNFMFDYILHSTRVEEWGSYITATGGVVDSSESALAEETDGKNIDRVTRRECEFMSVLVNRKLNMLTGSVGDTTRVTNRLYIGHRESPKESFRVKIH